MAAAVSRPSLTFGEGGGAVAFAALAVLCVVVATQAADDVMAFHALVGAAAAVGGVGLIVNRYYTGTRDFRAEIDGKPNYNLGPIKFSAAAAVVWG